MTKGMPMKWQCACAAAFVLLPTTAHADCIADAIKARAAILASGPFHLDAANIYGGCEAVLDERLHSNREIVTRKVGKQPMSLHDVRKDVH
jgi:hypothetical protein